MFRRFYSHTIPSTSQSAFLAHKRQHEHLDDSALAKGVSVDLFTIPEPIIVDVPSTNVFPPLPTSPMLSSTTPSPPPPTFQTPPPGPPPPRLLPTLQLIHLHLLHHRHESVNVDVTCPPQVSHRLMVVIIQMRVLTVHPFLVHPPMMVMM